MKLQKIDSRQKQRTLNEKKCELEYLIIMNLITNNYE